MSRANWIKATGNGGSGTQTLTSVSGFLNFNDVFGTSGTKVVCYVIQDADGTKDETGIGLFTGNTGNTATLARSRVISTRSGTTFDNTSPAALTFSSSVNVMISATAEMFVGAGFLPNTTDGASNSGLVIPPGQGNPTSSATATANRFYTTRQFIPWSGQLNKLGFFTYGAVAGNGRVGIYDIGTDGRGDNLLADSGSISTNATGWQTGTLSPNIFLPAGVYDFVMVFDAAAQLRCVQGSTFPMMVAGNSTYVPDAWIYNSSGGTYGALNADWASNASAWSSVAVSAQNTPLIGLGYV